MLSEIQNGQEVIKEMGTLTVTGWIAVGSLLLGLFSFAIQRIWKSAVRWREISVKVSEVQKDNLILRQDLQDHKEDNIKRFEEISNNFDKISEYIDESKKTDEKLMKEIQAIPLQVIELLKDIKYLGK